MTEQKKSALTAGTVIGAKETYQKQFTPNLGKTQEVSRMKYPMNPDKVIIALEVECGQKMDLQLKELWKLLVTLANDAYECGCCGEAYSADWVKKWKTCFGSEPDPKMKLMLEKVDQFMNNSYKDGKQAASAEKEIAPTFRVVTPSVFPVTT